MKSDIQSIGNNNQLTSILDSPTISGKISGNEEAKLLQMEFSAANSFTYKSTTIEATATKVTEASFYRQAPSREELNRIEDYHENEHTQELESASSIKDTQLTLTNENLPLSVSTASNHELISMLTEHSESLIAATAIYGASFTNLFSNTLYLIDTAFDDLKSKSNLYKKYIENSLTATEAEWIKSNGTSIDIKDGVRVINKYHYISEKQKEDSSSYLVESTSGNQVSSESTKFTQLETIESQINLDNSLTAEDAEKIHNQIFTKYPILNGQSLASLNSKIVSQLDIFLSRTYSTDAENAISSIQEVSEFYGKSKIVDSMLSIISLGIAKGANYPFTPYISHILKEKDDTPPTPTGATITIERKDPFRIIHTKDQSDINIETAAGFYRPEHNIALFLQDSYRMVHEITHGSMNIFFGNKGNPYAKGDEQQYHLAAKKILINIASKLGKNTEELQEMDLDSVYSYMMSSTPLDLFALSISPADSVKDFFSEKRCMEPYKFCKKYFENQDIDNITFKKVEIKFTETLNELNLTQEEIEVISEIGTVIFRYSQEDFDKELIAKVLETYYQYNNEITAVEILSPIEDYWTNNLSPSIENELIIPHQLECNGTIDSNVFEYCIEEYLS